MPKRKGLSVKTRFEVFKRDSFTCQYCGGNPPNIILEVDHIMPVSKGGENNMENLITSCWACNRGKRDGIVLGLPNDSGENLEKQVNKLKERDWQYEQYNKFLFDREHKIGEEVEKVEETFQIYYPNREFVESFKPSVKRFIRDLGLYNVVIAMEKACSRMTSSGDALNYFCGICWNMIKSLKNG